jgi:hypothetical protein
VDEELFAPPGAPRRERRRTDEPAGDAPSTIVPPEWSPGAPHGRSGEQADSSVADGVDADEVVAVVADDAGPPAPAAPPWRNPYLVGLVVGGAVLALVGFQMFRGALETIYVDFAESGLIFGGEGTADEASDPTAELVSMQLGWSLGPLLFILGLAAVLAVLVFVAVRWRPAATPGIVAQPTTTGEAEEPRGRSAR